MKLKELSGKIQKCKDMINADIDMQKNYRELIKLEAMFPSAMQGYVNELNGEVNEKETI